MSDSQTASSKTPARLAILPIAVLSLVFALIAIAIAASDRIELVSPAALLISGFTLYGGTVFLLSRTSMASITALEAHGITDSLCDLPNRRALHQDIARNRQSSDEVAVALIDLDGFKEINDHYGHSIGDQLIKEMANILSTHFEPEFAAVMIGPLAGTLLEGMCRSLLERLSKPIAIGDRRLSIGASIGLARSSEHEALTSSELLRRSDIAMSMSKRAGKMRCTWFNESFDRRREAVRELEDELRVALAQRQFTVAYQPLVNADNGRVVAVESLLRWTRADGEQVSPAVFVPIAEESGLINAIGGWVLRQAVIDALAWKDITLSVNISAAQLRNPEFPVQLGQILEETGFPPDRLELEITETSLVLDPDVAERSLAVIRSFGVKISLDDFGTGYASIGFLRQFRFEKLKLDRSLISEASEDGGSRAMMLSSIAMARALKMNVTAEGVETSAQADFVRTAGCDQIQGWLYFKAMPASEVSKLIERQNAADHVSLLPPESSNDEQAA